MNLKKLKDSLRKDLSIVFHSTRSSDELADIILNKHFKAGRNGGSMLGDGFYANQHLYQAQKGNYGSYILKAQVVGVKDFLILDKDQYTEFHGDYDGDFIRKQLDDKGLTDVKFTPNPGNSSQVAIYLFGSYFNQLKKKFYGFTYTGGHDKESIVCWYPEKCIRPLEFSTDKGSTWNAVKKAEDMLHSDDNSTLATGKNAKDLNLKKHEDIRSLQRAKDLVERYEKYPDAKLINAMESQLKRIADPAKRELRKDQFQQVLKKMRPDAILP